MSIDLLGRSVGDTPVMNAIPSSAPVSFRQVRGYRAGGSNYLIGEILKPSRNSGDEGDRDPGGFERDGVSDEWFVHGHLLVVHASPTAAESWAVKGRHDRPRAGLPFTAQLSAATSTEK